jgi:hypothetical protein
MGLGDLLLKIEKNIEKDKKTVSQEVDKMIQEIKTRYFSPE